MYLITAKAFTSRKQRNGPAILKADVEDVFNAFLPTVIEEVRLNMREGISSAIGQLSEKESVTGEVIVEDGRNPRLRVQSALVQAAVDETGATFANMPPYGPGSALREWVRLTLGPEPKKLFVTARGVAQAIMERGLPHDELREPFSTAFRNLRPSIVQELRSAGTRATVLINQGLGG